MQLDIASKNGNSLLSSAIRWFSQILFRLRPRPQLGHLAIPPEIMSMIAAHLSKPSLLSLALTCRTFYHYCFPQSPELSPSEKEEFLLLLEKDTPHLYFCHFCVKLHQWRAYWFRRFSPYFRRDFYVKDSCRQQRQISHDCAFVMPYPLARVVMNRHFYGAAHGMPAQKLDKHVRLTFGHVKYHRTWHARIIDDQLMLSSVLTLVLEGGEAKMLREFVETYGPEICHHVRPSKYCMLRPPELATNSSPPYYFTSCRQSVKSCPVCMTDYCIDITWQAKGWTIKIVTYHQLGAVRSPFDWNWSGMIMGGERSVLRSTHPSGYLPGIVRYTWSKADEVVLEPEGEWVTSSPWLAQVWG